MLDRPCKLRRTIDILAADNSFVLVAEGFRTAYRADVRNEVRLRTFAVRNTADYLRNDVPRLADYDAVADRISLSEMMS